MQTPPVAAAHAIEFCTQLISGHCPNLKDRCSAVHTCVQKKDIRMGHEFVRLTNAISTTAWNKFSMAEQRQILGLVDLFRE